MRAQRELNDSQKFPACADAIKDAILAIREAEEIKRDADAKYEFAIAFGVASNSLSGGAMLPPTTFRIRHIDR